MKSRLSSVTAVLSTKPQHVGVDETVAASVGSGVADRGKIMMKPAATLIAFTSGFAEPGGC